jgi:hypothetical protein
MTDHLTIRPQDNRIRDNRTRRPQGNGTEGSIGSGFLEKVFGSICRSQWSVDSSQRSFRSHGFTLAELLVSIGVLVLLVLLFTQLLNSAATITSLGHKRMDADSQARQLLDRMAIDFAQMVKRSDVDFFAKGTIAPNSVGGAMAGNDRIAFYSSVPGYYPPTGSQSPVSLVAYRINSDSTSSSYNKLERMGKGLVWNGVSTDTPVVFMPLTISANWPAATSSSVSDGAYEVIGPQVFRFEYRYLLSDGSLSTAPGNISGVAAVVVDIAVIDSKSKVLLNNTQIATVAGTLSDYGGEAPGVLLSNWRNTIDTNSTLPRAAIFGIRLYERQFYLFPPTL